MDMNIELLVHRFLMLAFLFLFFLFFVCIIFVYFLFVWILKLNDRVHNYFSCAETADGKIKNKKDFIQSLHNKTPDSFSKLTYTYPFQRT